ncbi:MAG: hypothetical protein ABWZ25_17540 [Chitinophagaceae bacterium]
MDTKDQESSTVKTATTTPVAKQVLNAFYQQLAKQDGFADIAQRLKACDSTSEVIIRQAIFNEEGGNDKA